MRPITDGGRRYQSSINIKASETGKAKDLSASTYVW